MKNIAVVEDNDDSAQLVEQYILEYSKVNNTKFNVIRFKTANDFLKDYKQIYSVVLLDIQMPGMNGMDAAFELRKIDKLVSIMFLTTLVQYAQKGYEVDAVSFLVKPVTYYDFSLKFKKALDIALMYENRNIMINTPSGVSRISTNKIMYIEINRHRLYYHLVDEVIEMTGVLSKVEEELKEYGFLKCNQCYLINPLFITSVKGKTVIVGGDELLISRPKYAQFMKELTNWYAGQTNK
ncbi:MAG: response regulator transcription factor [Bacilli bacterium]|nr:response regulator transcription factor [Bacilli bacterium]